MSSCLWSSLYCLFVLNSPSDWSVLDVPVKRSDRQERGCRPQRSMFSSNTGLAGHHDIAISMEVVGKHKFGGWQLSGPKSALFSQINNSEYHSDGSGTISKYVKLSSISLTYTHLLSPHLLACRTSWTLNQPLDAKVRGTLFNRAA